MLAAGPGAALSHRSAAALHGIRDGSGAIDVTTTRRVAVRGVVIHRTTVLDARDVTVRRGVRAITAERTLVDLAGILTEEQLGKLLREMDRTGRLNAAALSAALTRRSGRSGTGALRAALTSTDGSPHPSPSPSSRTAFSPSSMPRACRGR